MSKTSEKLKVHKFCSKLRHKIEDNFANKLGKSNRHSHSMSSLCGVGDSTNGKYINKSVKDTKGLRSVKPSNTIELPKNNPNGFTSIYVDSDDEYQMPTLSLTKQSLEDEIFAELEKAAHDEQKLNTVLKSFDRILTDFHEETVTPVNSIQNTIEIIPIDLKKSRSNISELTGSKIPVWKAKPLSKRSNSFCQPLEINNKQKKVTGLRHRAVSYTTLPQKITQKQQQKQQQNPQQIQQQQQYQQQRQIKVEKAKLVKSKTELHVKTKLQNRNKNHLNESKSGNLRCAHTNSDELLDKCMEKGQQILAKIESLGTKNSKVKSIENVQFNKHQSVTKYLAQKGRQNSDALSDDSGHISNEAEQNTDSLNDIQTQNTNQSPIRSLKITELLQKFEKSSSNTNNKLIPFKQQQQQPLSLLQKPLQEQKEIQQQQQQEQVEEEKHNNCTSIKLAEIETIHCVKTHIEIFPNYSKEVTTWFY